jgi:hypothetical protein
MFFLTFSSIWSFTYFLAFTYITFVLTAVIYTLPTLNTNLKYSFSKSQGFSNLINSSDILVIVLVTYTILLSLNLVWVAPSLSTWFGHLIITSFQIKVTYFILLYFIVVLTSLFSSTYFASREIYDFVATTFSFAYWITLLFMSNSIFTSIFIIEVISALIFLFLVTSTFSTVFFYRNMDLTFGTFFQNSTPYTFLQSIIFFFWMSLIASLNLFVFTILLYLKLLTFDWYLIEHVFIYTIYLSSPKETLGLGIAWFILAFSIFVKCGIAPLYVWKPKFFKGLPLYTICFYVTFFYFFIFLFVITFVGTYLGDLFYYFHLINLTFIVIGLIVLLAILCESYYIKSFVAMSSILNSLLALLTLITTHENSIHFWL